MSETGIENGDAVMQALKKLDGEASTSELSVKSGLPWLATLVAAGKLSSLGMIVKADRGHRKANPRWRLPKFAEQGFGHGD